MKKTRRPEVMGGLGGFGALCALPHPEVTTDYMFVDNAAMKMLQDPCFFDVMGLFLRRCTVDAAFVPVLQVTKRR